MVLVLSFTVGGQRGVVFGRDDLEHTLFESRGDCWSRCEEGEGGGLVSSYFFFFFVVLLL